MRPLQFAPISGRRSSVSRVTWWIAPSLAVHALFVAASGVGLVPRAKDDDRPAHEVIFLAPLLPKTPAPAPDADAGGGANALALGWSAIDATAKTVGDAVGAALGPVSRGSGSHTLAQAQRDLAAPDSPDPAAPGDDHIFQAVDVDREVAREADAVAPIYPEELRLKGVSGGVMAEFVVDTTGRVADGSLHIIGATHPLFAAAVREAAIEMHFRPAVRSGRLVKQQVIQNFQFVIRPAAADSEPAPPPAKPKRPDA
jgi:TonB family protein